MEDIEDFARKYADKFVKFGLMKRFVIDGEHRYKFTEKGYKFMRLSDDERHIRIRTMLHDDKDPTK